MYLKPCWTPVAELFAKIVNGYSMLTIFAKSSINYFRKSSATFEVSKTKKFGKNFNKLSNFLKCKFGNPVDTGLKLNVQKSFRRRPGRLLNVLSTFNLRPVSAGKWQIWQQCKTQCRLDTSFKLSPCYKTHLLMNFMFCYTWFAYRIILWVQYLRFKQT